MSAATIFVLATLTTLALIVRLRTREPFAAPSFDLARSWGPEGYAVRVFEGNLFGAGDGDVYQSDMIRNLPADFVPGLPSVPLMPDDPRAPI
jgi:hypothetical protein